MTSRILVLGAGRSSSALISYLQHKSREFDGSVTVGDISFTATHEQPFGKAVHFDIRDLDGSKTLIRSADVVISMLPAQFHPEVASLCLEENKHLLTASYVSDAMRSLDPLVKEKGLLFLNECGLDPGIDHMSAMQVIDRITEAGGKLQSFESFTGGLIAPETDPGNPWRYKFTWNPRNVVMAGQGVSKFLDGGQHKYIPYQQLFRRITPISIPGYGEYEGYANRDSLKYMTTYGLQGIETMLRGTLRCKGFCSAWDLLVQLGCTDDTYQIEGLDEMTHREFIDTFLGTAPKRRTEEKLINQFRLDKNGPEVERLTWSGFFLEEKIGLSKGTPAQVLEHILNKKWRLNPADKDLVVMWHRFAYEHDGKKKEIQSSLVVVGDDAINTAMARTVGLPLAIAANLLIQGKIEERGVVIPTSKNFYEPILLELKRFGISLEEKEY
jgi:saccharopine dehydrogenase-like NADP-dependent oxidoreductase